MKISDFTQDYIDLFREKCNFTDTESQIFEYKRKKWTDIQISMEMNMSESNVQAIMRKVRYKIDEVLKQNIRHNDSMTTTGCGRCIISHTMEEWSKIPNFLSTNGMIYIYSDYRTENEINIPRIKIGDGISPLSELPFATMSITDNDMAYWDNKPDTSNNNFGKVVEIDNTYTLHNFFVFPTDGYIMLSFESADDFAYVMIFGASGNSFFKFGKKEGIDIHSKEVFVKKGMRCEYVSTSQNAHIKFVPLV